MLNALESFTFEVLGRPRPKERPRLGRRGRVFTPARTAACEYALGLVALSARPAGWKMDCQYSIEMRFSFRGGVLADCDNLAKLVGDGLNGVAWNDDRQVVEMYALRVSCAPGEAEGTRVIVSRVSEPLPAKRKARPRAPSAVASRASKVKRAPRRRGRSAK